MLCVAEKPDQVGYFSLKPGAVPLDTALRYLEECPWRDCAASECGYAPREMLLRAKTCSANPLPDDVVEACRVRQKTASAPYASSMLNDGHMRTAIAATLESGAQPKAPYATRQVPSTTSTTKVAEELVAEGVNSICIKDMAGLIDPYSAEKLVNSSRPISTCPSPAHSLHQRMGSMATLKPSSRR